MGPSRAVLWHDNCCMTQFVVQCQFYLAPFRRSVTKNLQIFAANGVVLWHGNCNRSLMMNETGKGNQMKEYKVTWLKYGKTQYRTFILKSYALDFARQLRQCVATDIIVSEMTVS